MVTVNTELMDEVTRILSIHILQKIRKGGAATLLIARNKALTPGTCCHHFQILHTRSSSDPLHAQCLAGHIKTDEPKTTLPFALIMNYITKRKSALWLFAGKGFCK